MAKKPTDLERQTLEAEFQDTYNPTKIYQKIRIGGIPKDRAKKFCKYYEDTIYKPLCRMYDLYQRKEKLENEHVRVKETDFTLAELSPELLYHRINKLLKDTRYSEHLRELYEQGVYKLFKLELNTKDERIRI